MVKIILKSGKVITTSFSGISVKLWNISRFTNSDPVVSITSISHSEAQELAHV